MVYRCLHCISLPLISICNIFKATKIVTLSYINEHIYNITQFFAQYAENSFLNFQISHFLGEHPPSDPPGGIHTHLQYHWWPVTTKLPETPVKTPVISWQKSTQPNQQEQNGKVYVHHLLKLFCLGMHKNLWK